jgi:hypothetical protein
MPTSGGLAHRRVMQKSNVSIYSSFELTASDMIDDYASQKGARMISAWRQRCTLRSAEEGDTHWTRLRMGTCI